jgi:hypothetical protein
MQGSQGNPISPKLTASAVGPLIATMFWTLVAHYWLTGLSAGEVASMTAASGGLLAFALGYYTADPMRRTTT